jgi:hypothetical protein
LGINFIIIITAVITRKLDFELTNITIGIPTSTDTLVLLSEKPSQIDINYGISIIVAN